MAAPSRGAVLYDGLYVPGGAEQVTLELAALLRADLVCAARNEAMFPAVDLPVACRTLSGWLPGHPTLRLMHAARAFRKHTEFLRDYDWAIYSGSAAPLAAAAGYPGKSIYYCHTVPRFMYDLREFYLERVPAWQRPGLHALRAWLRPRYEAAVANIGTLVANSENVRARIRRYLDRDALVIHPPCDVEGYRWIEQGDYYLSTARLEPYKRVDVIVRAFLAMPDRKLVIASGGSDELPLRRLAADAPNIRFVGWQSAVALRELTGRALATIYIPKDEDFGISPVESMAAGKPVIGVAEGGLLETVLQDRTGFLLHPDRLIEGIRDAVCGVGVSQFLEMRSECERRAAKFSGAHFAARMRDLVEMPPNGCLITAPGTM